MDAKHEKASLLMLDTFRNNAGMFVKFGQLIASMGVLFPEQYVKIMSNMFQDAP
jgi:predicted unusual protein kinase regulating ubiquinone biosynthesis (AarF/ABC1/UbiB family)